MTEPRVEDVASLVPQRRADRRATLVVGDDHAALSGRHLLVRVEGEDSGIAERAHRAALVARADRLAGILDDGETVTARDVEDRIHVGGLTEDVDREDGPRTAPVVR